MFELILIDYSDFPNLETVILGIGAFCNAGTVVFESRCYSLLSY